jgi:putative intracellular protease/amidase
LGCSGGCGGTAAAEDALGAFLADLRRVDLGVAAVACGPGEFAKADLVQHTPPAPVGRLELREAAALGDGGLEPLDAADGVVEEVAERDADLAEVDYFELLT